jgi:regulatory protein
VRARGREELVRSLNQKGFAPATAREAVERLEREGWLDDLAAARSVVRSRQGRHGRVRIERELAVRGFSGETAAQAISELDPEGEEIALSRLFGRLRRSTAGLSPEVRRRRVFNALTRRGFSAAAISAKMKSWPGGSGDHEVPRQSQEDEEERS